MKKILSLALIVVLAAGCLAGCNGNKKAPNYAGLTFRQRKNGNYLCTITKDAPAEVTVPADYNGKKVTSLETEKGGCPNLEKLVVAASLYSIDDGTFTGFPKLSSVSFEGGVQGISEDAFENCPELKTITFGGAVDYVYSIFEGCPKLEPIVLPDGSKVKSYTYEDGVTVGTQDYFDWNNGLDTEERFEQVRSHLGEKWDDKTKIKAEDAAEFRTRLNGSVIYTDMCADGIPENYAADKISEKMRLIAVDCRNAQGALSAEDKAVAESNSDSGVYALVEATGSRDRYYGSTANADIEYLISYRISFWNAKTDELLGWFGLYDLGYAPEKLIPGGSSVFRLSRREYSTYLRDKEGNALTPEFMIEKYVYGITENTEYGAAD